MARCAWHVATLRSAKAWGRVLAAPLVCTILRKLLTPAVGLLVCMYGGRLPGNDARPDPPLGVHHGHEEEHEAGR